MPAGAVVALHAIPNMPKEMSRSHLEVQVDGWSIKVVDLGSANGTTVQLPGRDPVRLRANEPAPVIIGTVVTLADLASFEIGPPA